MTTPSKPRFYVACTVKNEGAFLLEWLAWNRLIGVDDILVFQNGSVDGTKELLQLLSDHGLLEYRDNDSIKFSSPQRYSYRMASNSELFKSADWAIAIDIDEFIRIDVPGGTLADLVAAYPEDADEIRLSWRNFGHSQQYDLSPDMVTQRFTETHPAESLGKYNFPSKTLFRTRAFGRFGVHSPKNPVNPIWNSYNGSGDRIADPATVGVGLTDPKRMQLGSVHHYIVKDAQNFVLKCDRGKSGHPNREMKTRYWRHWNARGAIDETLRAQADRIRAEIARIDEICGGKALPIQASAVRWRQDRYAELMLDPEYAEITRDIAVIEGQPVPAQIEALLAQPQPPTPDPAAEPDPAPLPDVVVPATVAATGPNLDFEMVKAQAEALGGEWHETDHHVVVHVPGRDRLVFGFDNLSSMSVPGPRKPWAFDLVRSQGWGSLGVMVKRSDWFRSDPLFDVLEAMRDRGVYAGYPAVSMYGASMGAFGAAAFAPLAPGCTVLAFAPQSTLDTDLAPFEARYLPARKRYDWANPRYRDGAEGIRAAGRAFILYDTTIPMDAAHVKRLDGPNIVDLGWPFLTHKIPPRLSRMKILKQVALAGLDGSLSRESFVAMMRARKDCNIYLLDMIGAAAAKGHHKLARAAMDHVLQTTTNWKARQMSRNLGRLAKGVVPDSGASRDDGQSD